MRLTEAEKEFYVENGYILLDNVFTKEEIDECCKEYDALFQEKSALQSNLEATWAGNWKQGKDNNTSVLSIHNLQCHSGVFTKMLLNTNLLDALEGLMGTSNILLHHTKAHIKPPQMGSSFPTHQDYHYFPFKHDSMVAVFIHLDDTEVINGGLGIFPGSHKLGPQENKSDVATHFYVDQEKFPLEKGVPVAAKRGQVVVFSYLLVHGSYPNKSDKSRRMLLFQMMAAEDEPLKEVHMSPCHGMVLRGTNAKQHANFYLRHEGRKEA